MPQRRRRQGRRNRLSKTYLTDPLTLRDAKRQAKVVRRLALGPQMRELKAEKRASQLRSKQIKDWFPQYIADVEKAQKVVTDAYGQAQSSVANTSKSSAAYAEALRSRLASEAGKDAKLRGMSTSDTTTNVGSEANLARINSANVLAGVLAGQGAAQSSYLADKVAIGNREKLEQLLREADHRSNIRYERRNLSREGRDLVRDELSRLRDSERDYTLARQAARIDKRGQNSQLKIAKQYGKNERHSQNRSLRNQLQVAKAQARNARKDDQRSRAWLNQGKGGGSDEGAGGKSVSRGAILGYVSDNATKKQVAQNPKIAERKVLSRWPYLDPAYVRKVVRGWAKGGGGKPTPDFSAFH